MFEKEAEEIVYKKLCSKTMCYNHCSFSSPKHHRCGEWHRCYESAKDGAEFGYNKANEWNYPSKGELPKASGNYILAFYGAEGSVASGKPCCEETFFDAELLRWKEIDTYDDLPYLEKKGVVIAWRELPEPPKEEE